MKRREQDILKASVSWTDKVLTVNEEKAFQAGAKWADKTMIEKACEYLRMSMYNTPIFEHDEDANPVNYVCASCCDSVEEFIENFRKAMEE